MSTTGETARPTRRRFLVVSGSAIAGTLVPAGRGAAAPAPAAVRWRGVALGAEATLTLHHTDGETAQAAIRAAVAEIRRLEMVFSLYDPRSALSRLNRDGRLDGAPGDLIALLKTCGTIHAQTNGAFDPTIGPLFDLYASHFAGPGADRGGPAPAAIAAARSRVGLDGVSTTQTTVRFTRSGMGLTLNGIAQGYITDRVADLLRARGFGHVLVDLGESYAVGTRGDGTPWRLGVIDPFDRARLDFTVSLADRAIATSGGYGHAFDDGGRYHHLIDPRTGTSARHWASVSVTAPSATLADALSTALSVTKGDDLRRIAEDFPQTAVRAIAADGRVVQIV